MNYMNSLSVLLIQLTFCVLQPQLESTRRLILPLPLCFQNSPQKSETGKSFKQMLPKCLTFCTVSGASCLCATMCLRAKDPWGLGPGPGQDQESVYPG